MRQSCNGIPQGPQTHDHMRLTNTLAVIINIWVRNKCLTSQAMQAAGQCSSERTQAAIFIVGDIFPIVCIKVLSEVCVIPNSLVRAVKPARCCSKSQSGWILM